MTPRRVGILGGMGPEATVLLMSRLIDTTPAGDDSDHVPLIVDQNPQVPSRIARLLEGRGEDPAPVLAAMAQRLELAGAEALAMPCNTAHYYAPAIRAAVGIPLIDMIELAADAAAARAGAGESVGVLASPALRRIGLFDAALARRGLVAAYAEDEGSLLAAIRAIKARRAGAEARGALAAASAGLLAQGAKVQLIACTEFSLIADAVPVGAAGIDTLDCLVDGILDFASTQTTAARREAS
ncbi:Aspartate racemase [Rubellimicrobium mesophilum DSM 19309]|uniref:Aspartate racemase n=1 Tax=Rubellimicrobium mesophilum DSM 19309 TaxID=442562 RepID=A0A017HSM7_9RHOB|nr:amino acid racemase [Rubellimicrobium mesophilum]EYD77487.1 Aspartate racemase [Rubellimicrobium mesophilum DSM 19309]